MITETTLPIERKGIDLIQVPTTCTCSMLAEPGWVIPAGRFERRYAALAVSTVTRGDREYFRAPHKQINEGGAEAMFYDLRAMELLATGIRGKSPRRCCAIPRCKANKATRYRPWEQWYVMLFHNGKLPGASDEAADYRFHQHRRMPQAVPRLRWKGAKSPCVISWSI